MEAVEPGYRVLLTADCTITQKHETGTNDFFFNNQGAHGGNATQAVTRMTKLLDIAFTALPDVTVWLRAASCTPWAISINACQTQPGCCTLLRAPPIAP